MPKISIVMPTYNQGLFLSSSIDSILKQTFQDFELIIVNDGSTDNTNEILDKYKDNDKIKIFNQNNQGTGSALNRGFRKSAGMYETWFASDNLLYPEALNSLNNILDYNVDVDYVYANCEIGVMDKDGLTELKRKNLKDEVSQIWDKEKIYERYNLGIVWLWRKDLRLKAGSNFMVEPCEDYEMTLRMVEVGGEFYFLDETLGWFRRHDANMSKKIKNTGYVENLVKKMVEKRDKKKITHDFLNYFKRVYNNNIWGGESKSGKGSDAKQTEIIKKEVESFIKKYNIKTILDYGCGDLAWMKEVLSEVRLKKYIGVDCVDDLIKENKNKYIGKFIEFQCQEKLDELIIPKCDLIICRDVLVHHTFQDVRTILKKMVNSNSKFIMMTQFDKKRLNIEIQTDTDFRWRPINFTMEPFSFPNSSILINEKCTQKDKKDTYNDKCLGIWKINTLKKFVENYEDIKSTVERNKNIWLPNIPKIAHFYWGGETLPFLRYLTVYSFYKLNPDWKIIFYYPKLISNAKTWHSDEHKFEINNEFDYYEDLKKLNIDFRQINFKKRGIDDRYPEVFKSDYLRWELLSTVGGIWSDMDILFYKPMIESHFNLPDIDTLVSINSQNPESFHSIGFLGSSSSNEYYKYINKMLKLTQPDLNDYQSLGATFLNRNFKDYSQLKQRFNRLNFSNILPELVYAFYPLSRVVELYQNGHKSYLTEDSIGVHWYAGHIESGKFCFKVNHINYKEYNNTPIGRLIKNIWR